MNVSQSKSPVLSKSRFLAGIQCRLRLWHQCYNRDLASETSPAQQAVFDMGHKVGELATHLYPGGILIEEDHLHHKEAVQSTLKAMDDPEIKSIYEAAFLYDGVRIRVDILQRLDSGAWNLIEVKSSTSEKDIHLPDVAVQYHVLKGSGLNIDQVLLIHLNNQYVYDGNNLVLEQFFLHTDMTKKTLIYQNQVPSLLADFNKVLSRSEEPTIRPDRHCSKPYECEFWEHCTKEMPEHWVMDLAGIGQKRLDELAAMGIEDIHDVPETFLLSEIQARIKICVKNDKEYISKGLEDELKEMEYPIHFLDFETLGPAIPRYSGTRPYQTIPFQWSDHILHEDGTIEHREYLCEADKDPREECTLSLLNVLGNKGSIITFTDYEEKIIKDLAMELPECREQLHTLPKRITDLHKIIRRDYYNPEFHGSFSLKSVLPVLLPTMDYGNLAIQEGTQASVEYLRMIDPATPSEEKMKIKKDLLRYCGHDTIAMLRIRDELMKRFKVDQHG